MASAFSRRPSAIGHKTAHVRDIADLINNDELAARGSGFIDLLLIVGIIAAILLVDRFGSIRLQIVGFIGCAVGLAIAAARFGGPPAGADETKTPGAS